MPIIIYSNGCPRCNVLKRKLNDKKICFEEYSDVEKMLEMGISEVPVLSVDGRRMGFSEAVSWVNNYVEGCDTCK